MRRLDSLLAFALAAFLVAAPAGAQGLEKTKITIGVGGKPLIYYLPLTIAERKGYFKQEGLDVEIPDFPGGAKALQALLGGSVDIVSGAYEHTISQQAKGQRDRSAGAGGPVLGHRARAAEGQGRGVQVAGRPQGHEDRRHRAGLVDEHVRQHPAREGGPQARRRVDHRRRRAAPARSRS